MASKRIARHIKRARGLFTTLHAELQAVNSLDDQTDARTVILEVE